MAASKNPHVRLLHMKQELDWMTAEFSGLTYEAFVASIINVRATEHGLLIISEAARTLPDDMLAAYPHIEWQAIRGIGNVLRHDYEQISPHRLWVTLTTYLPELDAAVADMLARHSPPA